MSKPLAKDEVTVRAKARLFRIREALSASLKMTYWTFHLAFILPMIGALLLLNRRASGAGLPRLRLAFALVAAAAFVYTTPWDNYLVYRGIWSYPPDRISPALVLGYVPLEEYCFFLLQPVLTGLCLVYFSRHFRLPPRSAAEAPRSWRPRLVGGLLALLAGGLGGLALHAAGRWTYFGLILAWASPVLALHWLYGGDHLWRARRLFGASLAAATAYLWIVDRIALESKIWSISPDSTTGWNLLGLPAEEATFFVVTNLLVIQGFLLFFEFVGSRPTRPA